MTKQSKKLTVTAMVNTDGNLTAFFDELPGLVVQGKTFNDISVKLRSLLDSYLKRYESRKNNFDIQIIVV